LNLERCALNCDARAVRKRWKILLLGACGLVAVVAVCFFCLREQEPSYNGRTLSEWLDLYDEENSIAYSQTPRDTAAVNAVRAIGTNAIPMLSRWARTEDSQIQLMLHRIEARVRMKPRAQWFSRFVWRRSAQYRQGLADAGFFILGTNALPFLNEMLRDGDPHFHDFASNMVAEIARAYPTNGASARTNN
jgi:hypothetical protein